MIRLSKNKLSSPADAYNQLKSHITETLSTILKEALMDFNDYLIEDAYAKLSLAYT
jgi:hypothetical protein